jgi:uncharacterized membrane protein YcaP (DUF421 family)
MNNMWPMFYETVFGILALFILTKVLGKTQISQLTAFDFIAAIILGELVGNALFDKKAGILDIGFVIVLWGVILFAIEMITQKFKGSRYLLEGKPALIIHEGEIIYEELRKNKMDLNEILHLLRLKDVFALQEVEYAVLETDGVLSVLKKPEYQTPNKKDMNVKPVEANIAMPLIMDGELIQDNLAEANVSEEWLIKEIDRQGFPTVRHVFYAEWLEGKKLYVLPYKKIKEKHLRKKLKKS